MPVPRLRVFAGPNGSGKSTIKEQIPANLIGTYVNADEMSFKDKVEFMQLARANGYRTYLYFVATESPEININRVANRVDDGGHDVAQDKIIERYYRSVELLPAAIAASNRAYIFDNSGEQSVLLAEVTDGTELQFHEEEIPDWFVHGYVDKVTNSGDY